jgi:sigma-B regulation protein RsbU (phosphoserine phosphatase)
MLLRSRLTVLASAVLAMLIAGFAATILHRDTYFSSRYNHEVSQVNRFAWEKIAGHYRDDLSTATYKLLAYPGFAAAVNNADSAAMSLYVDRIRKEVPNLRVDIFSPARTLLYSTMLNQVDWKGLLDSGALQQILASGKPMAGLTQTGSKQFYWLRAEVVTLDGKSPAFVLSLGMDVLPALKELKSNLDSDVYLANLKGRMAHGTDQALFEHARFVSASRSETVSNMRVGDKNFLVTNLPQVNPEGRLIGVLVGLRDVTEISKADSAVNYTLLFGVSVFAVVFLAMMFFYLRSSFEPLSQTVRVLDALAKGDTQTQLADDIDDSGNDETAHIARGVTILREEMLTFMMLRDERRRARTQQERVIRDELRTLAANLDAEARDEVLMELSGQKNAALDGFVFPNQDDAMALSMEPSENATNQLAVLASTLGRMTGMISAQQAKLLQLLREVSAAAESKAKLAGLQQELEIARKMQLAILPRTAPDRSELTITAAMIPAKEIGGDFYDYFMLDEHRLAIVVADVSGKGVAAAFFMAISRTLLKSTAKFLQDPQACITELNELLCIDNDQMMFVTLFYGILDLTSGRFQFVNAGHNPPVLIRKGGVPEYFPRSPSMVLAVMEGASFPSQEIVIQPGDMFVFYTDGVTEATDPDGVLYGDDRLLQTLQRVDHSADVSTVTDLLMGDIRVFERGAPQADDITCVVLNYLGNCCVTDFLPAEPSSTGTH